MPQAPRALSDHIPGHNPDAPANHSRPLGVSHSGTGTKSSS